MPHKPKAKSKAAMALREMWEGQSGKKGPAAVNPKQAVEKPEMKGKKKRR